MIARLSRASVAVAALAAATAAACATEGSSAHTIALQPGRGFVPSAVTVRAGDRVVFDNRTTRAHALSGGTAAGELESGRVLAYESWTVQLPEPGTYTFVIADDPAALAVVEVTP